MTSFLCLPLYVVFEVEDVRYSKKQSVNQLNLIFLQLVLDVYESDRMMVAFSLSVAWTTKIWKWGRTKSNCATMVVWCSISTRVFIRISNERKFIIRDRLDKSRWSADTRAQIVETRWKIGLLTWLYIIWNGIVHSVSTPVVINTSRELILLFICVSKNGNNHTENGLSSISARLRNDFRRRISTNNNFSILRRNQDLLEVVFFKD